MVTIERVGRRSYLRGNTYPHRDAFRAAGANWDPEQKAWWLGSQAKAEELVASLAPVEAPVAGERAPEKVDESEPCLIGRGKYKGKTYYVMGRVTERGASRYDRDEIAPIKTRDGGKLKLAFRDGSSTFWAPIEAVTVEKRYAKLQSIRGLREFAEQAKTHGPVEEGYYIRGGEVLAAGCSQCARLGRMCDSCAHDYE